MVPEGWRQVPLTELVTFKSGGTPSTQNPDYWGGEIPWISAKDFTSLRLSDSQLKVTMLGAQSGTRLVPAGTVLILVRGMTLHKDVPIGLTTQPMTFNQDVRALLPKNGVSPEFLAYSLVASKQRLRQFVDTAGHGTGRLASDFLQELPILLPPTYEQASITRCLTAWDTAIMQTEKLIEAKRKLKKGLMQQLLTGKQQLSEFREPWLKKKLGEVFHERKETNSPELPLLSITGGRGVIPQSEIDRKDSSAEDKSKYKRIAPGDIGYNTMRMWQGVSALSCLEGIVSPAYTICIPKYDIDGSFAAYLFKFPPVVHLFYRYSQGLVSDTLNLKFPQFAQVTVDLPPLSEQKKIAAVLGSLDREIASLVDLSDKIKEQKRGLMQKLLTGQIRVKATAEITA
jgi:type I restriction enzyme S subunit